MTKMTLYQFNALSFEDQLSSVWNQGTFLLVRPVGRSKLCLYALGNFFVEIRLNARYLRTNRLPRLFKRCII